MAAWWATFGACDLGKSAGPHVHVVCKQHESSSGTIWQHELHLSWKWYPFSSGFLSTIWMGGLMIPHIRRVTHRVSHVPHMQRETWWQITCTFHHLKRHHHTNSHPVHQTRFSSRRSATPLAHVGHVDVSHPSRRSTSRTRFNCTRLLRPKTAKVWPSARPSSARPARRTAPERMGVGGFGSVRGVRGADELVE